MIINASLKISFIQEITSHFIFKKNDLATIPSKWLVWLTF